MKNIKYIPSKCIGCGICSSDAPHIFEMDSLSGKALLLDGQSKSLQFIRPLWPDELQIIESLVKLCAVKAIQIV